MEISISLYLDKVVKDLEVFRLEKIKAYNRYKKTTLLLIKIVKVLIVLTIPVAIFVPPLWIVFIGLLLLARFLSGRTNPKHTFTDHVKTVVLPELFQTINSTFEYKPYYSDKDNILKSGILKSSYFKGNSKIVGEDYIKGLIADVDIECSELHFYRIEKNWVKFILLFLTSFIVYPILIILSIVMDLELESIGWLKLANEEKLFYRGFLMTADFHKSFQGELILLPKHQKNMVEKLDLNVNINAYKKITLENPKINDIFEIYTKSEQEGFYILSPTMLSAIEELCLSNGDYIPTITFIDGNMNILIPKPHDSFEVDLNTEIKDNSYFTRNINDIMVLPKLIEHFKLEDRLWSK